MNLLPSQVWLLIGIALCVIELLVPLPTFMIAGAMGLAALLVGLIALILPIPALQILAWMLISAMLAVASRRFIPKDSHQLKEASEGVTLTEIPAGETGRVRYEGGSWKAKCDNPQIAIAAQQKVIILRRQGTTLIVVPENWLSH
ncbi:NfeD family protein [Pseudanabaena galeata UHCC 0370]|jgi:membrane protein implicated in regulation of membrane protease activity|uniref:NfeD family protein n=1 Tax=Pseudanabaena galeata UHCC 0370 TaxID=3110310 RepID=A0ABU5TPW1_9CYAN|nr:MULTISPECIES: NfeD family protein [Pseudanabaena]MEA5480314.1 NfeD family protein [Pseudanabaena galeata UHCC 0370]MEA5487862.1 NfeD family protein [Pseudanabaena sp. CCNP1317]WGS74401.1 NfeD family protein [Pseudanabaena galeata CCNP1313]